MTRKLTPGDRVRHNATGREYTFHAHPSSQDFPGSRYVRDESGAIREFRADEIEAINTTPVKLTPAQLDEIEQVASAARVPLATGGQLARLRTDSRDYIATLTPGTTLALIAEVRELRAAVERTRKILHDAACGGAITAYELRMAIDDALEALGEEA